MSENNVSNSSNLLNLIIDHCYTSVCKPPKVANNCKEAKTNDEPADPSQHVFKVPAVPSVRFRKNKVLDQNEVSKKSSKKNLDCDDSLPPWDCRKCKHLSTEEETVNCKESAHSLNIFNKDVKFLRKCSKCLKSFACKVAYLQHKQKCRNRHSRTVGPLFCGVCLQLFDCQASFEKHKKRCLHRCIHPGCYNSFISRSEMVKHLNENHMGDDNVYYLEFKNWNMLNIWKVNEAIVNMLSYENKSFQDITHHYFTCHRLGTDTKLCPSRMLIYESVSSVVVKYIPFHNHELFPDGLFDYKSQVPIICLYPECVPKVSFYRQSEMLAHLQKFHKININCECKEFKNIIEFFIWMGNETSPHFMYLFRVKGHAVSKNVHTNYHYFLCGYNGKHSLEKQTQCLARMVVYELENCVKVRYFPYHIHPLTSPIICEKILNGHCGIEIPLVAGLNKKQIL